VNRTPGRAPSRKFGRLTLLLCLSLTWSVHSVKGQPRSPFVHAEGKQVVDGTGKPVLLRGTNLGNWLVPEGYMLMLDRGAASPRELERLFNELIGPTDADEFWREYRRKYITRQDIAFLHRAGFNSIRIPLHYKFFLSDDSEGFTLLDQVVGWARDEGLWVIVDLHCAPGGQTGTNIDDSWGYPWLFESRRDQDLSVEIWTRIARHYRNEPAILGYDLLNEPIPPFSQVARYNGAIKPLYQRMTTAIRKVDSQHMIILEGSQWDGNFDIFTAPLPENVLYEFHKYWTAPTQATIQQYLDFRDKHNVPLWLGESGETDDKWIQSLVGLLKDNQIGWCFWPYKKMMNRSGVTSFPKPAYWDEIITYAEVPGTSAAAEKRLPVRPTLEHSRRALQDLLQQIGFEHCAFNPAYLRALGLTAEALPMRSNYEHGDVRAHPH
jgi:endoglucanase